MNLLNKQTATAPVSKMISSFVTGLIASVSLGAILYVSFITIPVLHAQNAVLPSGGIVFDWMPCCESLAYITNPAVEQPPLAAFSIKNFDLPTAPLTLRSEIPGTVPFFASNTLSNQIPFAGVCFALPFCEPIPGLSLITLIGATPPTIPS